MTAQRIVGTALLTFVVWSFATWLLEGRIETLLRPEAAGDRVIYALVANILIGLVGSFVMLRRWQQGAGLDPARSGFASAPRSALWLVVGALLGLAFYWLQGAPSRHPMVILNAFAQVFNVSAAEIVVCWALVARALETALTRKNMIAALIVAAIASSVLFGLYHFAHSAPFNTWQMVGLLSVVGLVTSVFFLVSRDVAATMVFHNFLGTFGVVQALEKSGRLTTYEQAQAPLLIAAVVTAAVVAWGYYWLRRRRI